jgi:hypothetical protein
MPERTDLFLISNIQTFFYLCNTTKLVLSNASLKLFQVNDEYNMTSIKVNDEPNMTSIKVNDEHNMTSIKVIFQCPKIQI